MTRINVKQVSKAEPIYVRTWVDDLVDEAKVRVLGEL